MPEGVEHKLPRKNKSRGSSAFLPLMPEGVEHEKKWLDWENSTFAFLPLMPEGVEHLLKVQASVGCVPRFFL